MQLSGRSRGGFALSVDGSSVVSPRLGGNGGCGSGLSTPFFPSPLKAFRVAVSAVPGDQLRCDNSVKCPSGGAGGSSALSFVDRAGGAAGVSGLPSMACSIPATMTAAAAGGSICGPPANTSFHSNPNASFALTKSFDDVFARKRQLAPAAGAGSSGSGGVDSGQAGTNGSMGSSHAMAAAAAALNGHGDLSLEAEPVPDSFDTYRVHLLLPPPSERAADDGTRHSLCDSPRTATEDKREVLAAATAPLEALRTPKPKQVVQVQERWMRFQQLVRFVLSVAPRFELPPTPPGFDFPVDLDLSFVQNSSMFSAAAAASLQHDRNESEENGGNFTHAASMTALLGEASGKMYTREGGKDERLVGGAERAARRAYMERYLNDAIQCDQVNCLSELQSFVGYQLYVQGELASHHSWSDVAAGGVSVMRAVEPANDGQDGVGGRTIRGHVSPLQLPCHSPPTDPPVPLLTGDSTVAVLVASSPANRNRGNERCADRSPPSMHPSGLPPAATTTAPALTAAGLSLTSAAVSTDRMPEVLVGGSGGRGEDRCARVGLTRIGCPGDHLGSSGDDHGAPLAVGSAVVSSGHSTPPFSSVLQLGRTKLDCERLDDRDVGGTVAASSSSSSSSHSPSCSAGSSASRHHCRGRRTTQQFQPSHHRNALHVTNGNKGGHAEEEEGAVEGVMGKEGQMKRGRDDDKGGKRDAESISTGGTAEAADPLRGGVEHVVLSPETERVLMECFRMMDVAERGYISAGDSLLFFLCATPQTFGDALHIVTSTTDESATDLMACLEELLPSWVRECDAVVLGDRNHLVSYAHFLDAVRQVLAASATAGATAAAAPSPHRSVPPAISGSTLRCSTRSATGNSPPRVRYDGSTVAELCRLQPLEVEAPPVAGTTARTLEMWIDHYWLLLYAQVFTAVVALVVGPEAAELRAALLELREKAYRDWAMMCPTEGTGIAPSCEACATSRATPLRAEERADVDEGSGVPSAWEATAEGNGSAFESAASKSPCSCTFPPWFTRQAAMVVASQPPLLGGYDTLELVCLVFLVTQAGLRVVSLEEVLQWLGSDLCASPMCLDPDAFASMLDALSCVIPFSDVLRCVRDVEPSFEVDDASPRETAVMSSDKVDVDSTGWGSSSSWYTQAQLHTRLLRLVARCVVADPAAVREFNERVREHRRKSKDAGHGCARCRHVAAMMDQQASQMAKLSEENALLRQRLQMAEEAQASFEPRDGALEDAAASSIVAQNKLSPAKSLRSLLEVHCPRAVESPDGADAPDVGTSSGAAFTSFDAAGEAGGRKVHRRSSNGQLPPVAASPAAAEELDCTSRSNHHHHHHPHTSAIELIPVFTSGAGTATCKTVSDPRVLRHASPQEHATWTHVTRPGALMYAVPHDASQHLAQQQQRPTELQFSFYLCREGRRGGRRIDGNGSVSNAAPGVLVPPVERLALRDANGRRVAALKFSHEALFLFGSETVSHRGCCTRPDAPFLVNASAPTVTVQYSDGETTHVQGPETRTTMGYGGGLHDGCDNSGRRPRNILFPRFDDDRDADCGGSDEEGMTNVFRHSGPGWAGLGRGARMQSSSSPAMASAASVSDERWRTTCRDSPTNPIGLAVLPCNSATTRQRICRADLCPRMWYTITIRFDWEGRRVRIRLAPCAASCAMAASGASVVDRLEYEVGMLDGYRVEGLSRVDVYPRSEMLLAYCNMVVRYG